MGLDDPVCRRRIPRKNDVCKLKKYSFITESLKQHKSKYVNLKTDSFWSAFIFVMRIPGPVAAL